MESPKTSQPSGHKRRIALLIFLILFSWVLTGLILQQAAKAPEPIDQTAPVPARQ